MKVFYLTGSIILTVLILILAFENIAASCAQLVFFFYPLDQSPTLIFLGIAILGIATGAFYHAFMTRILGGKEEEENEF